MLEFSTVKEWKEVFGEDYEDAVFELIDTHHLFRLDGEQIYFHLDLQSLFDEAMDMYGVDPDLVDDTLQLCMVFSDTESNPNVLTNLIDFSEDKLGYSPVDNAGGYSLHISDIRKYYGETEFDKKMEELFPCHTRWWEESN